MLPQGNETIVIHGIAFPRDFGLTCTFRSASGIELTECSTDGKVRSTSVLECVTKACLRQKEWYCICPPRIGLHLHPTLLGVTEKEGEMRPRLAQLALRGVRGDFGGVEPERDGAHASRSWRCAVCVAISEE